ncbi:hypothetical protein HBN50_14535 [Halobacteriovorax sp. GB3]|uniref:hypothetical protein n=1 Tax=Halobacteriovorax sp. GB3 TaxID=2719615 RepID=UPI00235FD582|nr:hypothetical protein [Halobacteriovorax sp. GB3]MDD0854326.1 hypothetical protein [Halobacteriovorax sp. GB3]
MKRFLFSLCFIILSIDVTSANSALDDVIKKRTIIADIYCEAFGERPDISMQGKTWNALGGPFKDLYQVHVRQFLAGDIDLFKVLKDVNTYKKTYKSPSNQQGTNCRSVKGGKTILEHYNDLHKSYCSIIGIKREDQDPYFINNLFELYYRGKSLSSLQKFFKKEASNKSKKNAKKCTGYQEKSFDSKSNNQSVTLEFRYPTHEEIISSPVSKYASYRDKPFCGEGKVYDYAKLELAFNQSVHYRIDQCINSLRGHKDFKCFEIDLKTKNRERDCQTERDYGKRIACAAEARDKGNLESLASGCKRGLNGYGNNHLQTSLTGEKMSSFCPLSGPPETLHFSQNGNSNFYHEERGDIHQKFNRCILQGCYDEQKRVSRPYGSFLERKARECGISSDFSFECYVFKQAGRDDLNICTTRITLRNLTDNHPMVKKLITSSDRKSAKNAAGLYINNAVFNAGKAKDGTRFSAFFTANLDTNGELVSGNISITQRGHQANFKPRSITKNGLVTPAFKNFNKFELDWESSVFNPNAKDSYACPATGFNDWKQKYIALNTKMYYTARSLGCTVGKSTNADVSGCDQIKLSKAVTEHSINQSRLFSEAQTWLSGHENPALTPKEGSILALYPICQKDYPSYKEIFDNVVDDIETAESKDTMSDAFKKQVAIVTNHKNDKNLVQQFLNKELASHFKLPYGAIRVPMGNGEIENGMVYEVESFKNGTTPYVENPSYGRFLMGIERLDQFKSQLENLYCKILGVKVSLEDKYFFKRFQKASQLAFHSNLNMNSILSEAQMHFENELRVNSKSKPWLRGRKRCK